MTDPAHANQPAIEATTDTGAASPVGAGGEPPILSPAAAMAAMVLPQATPGVVDPLPSGPAPVLSGGKEVDRHGVAFDPAKHEHRIRPNGHWALKRGNGARAAKGLPFAGATSGRRLAVSADPARPPTVAIPPESATAEPAAGDSAAAPATAFRPGAFLAPEVPAAGSGATVAGNAQEPPGGAAAPAAAPVPVASLTPQDYQLTAEGITGAQFGLASMALGPAWEPDRAERQAWTAAWARTMAHYQTPILGPVVELVVLAIGSVSRRFHDATTQSRVGAFWRWMRRQPAAGAGASPTAAAGGSNPPAPAKG